jgi:hypothetical protein
MTPTYASKNGGRRYGYYVCTNALQRGRAGCPSRSLPGAAIEEWVLERLQEVAREADAKQHPLFAELGTWEKVSVEERTRLIHNWIERVDYDGTRDKAAITFAGSIPKNSKKGKRP